MEETQFKFPINSSLVIEIVVVMMVLIVGVVAIAYLRGLNIVTDNSATSDVGNLSDDFIMIVGVIVFCIVIAALFLIFKTLKKSK